MLLSRSALLLLNRRALLLLSRSELRLLSRSAFFDDLRACVLLLHSASRAEPLADLCQPAPRRISDRAQDSSLFVIQILKA